MTGKEFRRRVLRPAEGIFLFHPGALVRLLGLPGRLKGGAEDISYHLMSREGFLERLEPENPEALSVIEGLTLPDYVLLLPMPSTATLRSRSERDLLRDYWAKRFEGEVARAWQTSRDDNTDLDQFGPNALQAVIGDAAFIEAGDILARGGVPAAADGLLPLCRAFVGRVVRLRYFAPGTRGCWFPAIHDWPAVDRWLEASGLDLPRPLSGGRSPLLLERSRPSAACGAAAVLVPLPERLSFGRSDPERPQVPSSTTVGGVGTTAKTQPPGADLACSPLQGRCLALLREGAAIRRRQGLRGSLALGLDRAARSLLEGVLRPWDAVPRGAEAAARHPRGAELSVRTLLLRLTFAAARWAEWKGQYAAALAHLANAHRQYRRLAGPLAPGDQVDRWLEEELLTLVDSFASILAANWKMTSDETRDLPELIRRLATEGWTASAAAARYADAALENLQTALLEGRAAYYRISLRSLLRNGRARQMLPFQGPLRALSAVEIARHRLDGLPWPGPDLDRLGAPLAALAERIGDRLEQQLEPRLAAVLEDAGLRGEGLYEELAVRRLRETLLEIIRRCWLLRFSDVRDFLAEDALSRPDLNTRELLRGDPLSRFDRAAAAALPGVYQHGEVYVKGLQRLTGPLFGTRFGRRLLRVVLLPALMAWAGLETVLFFWGHIEASPGTHYLSSPEMVLPLAAVLSIGANTQLGRRLARGLWRMLQRPLRLLFARRGGEAARRLRRWTPLARILSHPLVRGPWDLGVAPLAMGLLSVFPLTVLISVYGRVRPGAEFWTAALAVAFATGTLLRNTPGGRRRLDDLVLAVRQLRVRIGRERIADLVAPVVRFFEDRIRILAEWLHRIQMQLSLRLNEPAYAAVLKAMLAPLWSFFDAIVRFYAVVLIEPQTNPVKHFPVVTVSHKLMLPVLPALSVGLTGLLEQWVPEAVALPLVAFNLFLLPGFFGFLFWELKEDRKLYAANRSEGIPPARLGPRGEPMSALVRRGFHSGAVPKLFDRLRKLMARQVRSESSDPGALREILRVLDESEATLGRFGELELGKALQALCGRRGGVAVVEMDTPCLFTRGVEFRVKLHPVADGAAVLLRVTLFLDGSELRCQASFDGPLQALDNLCRSRIEEAVYWFARRGGAARQEFFWAPALTPDAVPADGMAA